MRRPRRITGAQRAAAGLVAMFLWGGSSVAEAVEVGTLAELGRIMNDGSTERIVLTADMNGYGWLDASNETPPGGVVVEAGDFTLPPMDFGKGEYTIVGGKIDDDTVDSTGGERQFHASSLIRISSEASVTFDGTTIGVSAPADRVPAIPHTIFELYSGPPSDQASKVELIRLIAGTSHPLHVPLTLTTASDTYSSDGTRELRIADSFLAVRDGAALHGAVLFGTTDAEPVPAAVTVENTRILGINSAGSGLIPEVGSAYRPDGGALVELGFLHTTGAAQLVSSRVSNLKLQGRPLVEAPAVLLDRVMIDGVHQDREDAEAVTIAHGEHVQVVSSLMCDLTGGGAILGAQPGSDAAPATALLMHSALWQLGQSLFTMEAPTEEQCTNTSGKAGLVAANVTLHRAPDAEPMDASISLITNDEAVCGSVLNTYLEGAWDLGVSFAADDPLRMVAESLIMNESGTADATEGSLCGGMNGCRDDVPALLPESLKNASCRDVMDQLEAPLLEGDSQILVRDLADLAVSELEEDSLRPALGRLVELPGAATWSYPDPPADPAGHGGWAVPDGSDVATVDCASHTADEEVALGAWASGGNPCSLPVLEVWEVEGDAPPDDPEPSSYGLADGCRYGSAWLFAPLFWGRTRRRSSRSGDRP